MKAVSEAFQAEYATINLKIRIVLLVNLMLLRVSQTVKRLLHKSFKLIHLDYKITHQLFLNQMKWKDPIIIRPVPLEVVVHNPPSNEVETHPGQFCQRSKSKMFNPSAT